VALYFVRHGETDWNAQKRFQSFTDVPLNERGLAQAECIRLELLRRGVQFAAVRCSPLGRAVTTAQIICGNAGVQPVVEPRFTEMSFGEWEGQLEQELADRYGEQYAAWRGSHYTTAPPGGQALGDVADRVGPALEELRGGAQVGQVLIVAHQAIMMAMKAYLTGDYSIAAAFSYKQNNDEVDVWDLHRVERLELFKVECE
jgi:broad specificity phosphatase PhoE